MTIEELLDEEAFNPKKLFNEEEYSTLILNRDGFSKKENTNADIVEALLDNKNTRAENEALYAQLKELGAQDLLVSAIKSTENIGFKARLLAACWETGLDFSKHFLLFVEYACHDNFDIAFEASTIIENEEGTVEQSVLQQALIVAQNCKSKYNVLIEELIDSIKSRLT
jgi:hypothetical protein